MNNEILKHKTKLVIIITFIMMIAEIFYGVITNSMSLTADGIHMGTHVLAFGITLAACIWGMKYPDKSKKMNALGGFASAILLGLTAVCIIYESFERFFKPLSISFNDAILVAVIGLIVNIVCIIIMGGKDSVHNEKCHYHCECFDENVCVESHEENLNYKAAYLHIAADILTSVMAIVALILGKYAGWVFLDPLIGVGGGLIIANWTVNLLKTSSKILLDF